ncbi:MAG: MotA/TolQ/ExbB proton channel family protein [Candidatus Binatia bacterium]
MSKAATELRDRPRRDGVSLGRSLSRTFAVLGALAYVAVITRAGLDPLAGMARGIAVFGPTFPALVLVGWLLTSDAVARVGAALGEHRQPAAPAWLTLCTEASPMLGLLGTVIAVGLGLSTLGAESPETLVRSFGQALWSTALGLSLALLGEWLKHLSRNEAIAA